MLRRCATHVSLRQVSWMLLGISELPAAATAATAAPEEARAGPFRSRLPIPFWGRGRPVAKPSLSSCFSSAASDDGFEKVPAEGRGNDAIVLKGMSFFARHGVLEEEAVLGQRFTVDLKMHCCLEAAGRTDDVNETVDYSKVYGIVRGIVEGERRYKLIETIAQDIAESILRGFPRVESVEVAVKKPQVALMGELEYSGVEIHRIRWTRRFLSELCIKTAPRV